MRSFGRALAVTLLLGTAAAAVLRAQGATAETSYKSALAQEAEVRREMEAPVTSAKEAALLRRIRSLVGVYNAIAVNHPTSGYSDNALWQGALLSADAFWQFGKVTDRDAARRMMLGITSRFPTSSLVARIPDQLSRLERTASPKPSSPPSTAAARPAASRPAAAPASPRTGSADVASTATPASAKPAPAARPAPGTAAIPAAADSPATITAPAGPATLTAIRREVLPDAVRVTLSLEHETPFETERLDKPSRLAIDLLNTRAVYDLKDARLPFTDDVVRQVRVGRQEGIKVRVVLDLEDAGRHSVYAVYNPYRLVIDFERRGRTSAPSLTASSATPTPAAPATTGRGAAPKPAASATATTAAANKAGTTTKPGAAPKATPGVGPPSAPRRNGRGGFSISRQLGLGVARIVIDPGHGGHDPGARVNGLTEAELVLDVSLRLEKLLLAQPGAEVVLTRRNSTFISLEERTAIANRTSADLFLSIHANASTNTSARGIETYFLNFAQDARAEAVAARENAGSSRTMSNLNDIVKAITLNNKIDESRDFARLVQSALFTGLKKANRDARDLGVKQAPFQVLIGASMPSILAEISFITNAQEGKLLKTDKYRDEIAAALFNGILNYQSEVKQVQVAAK